MVVEKANVDTIDRRRVLSAIQTGLFPDRPPRGPIPPAPPARDSEEPLEEIVQRAVVDSETQETLLSVEEEDGTEAEAMEERFGVTEKTVPPVARSATSEERRSGSDTTRLRLSEPLIHDESLAEMARGKVPEPPSSDLFSGGRERARPPRPPVPKRSPSPILSGRTCGTREAWSGGSTGARLRNRVSRRSTRADGAATISSATSRTTSWR
jgi:hypothetical protein